MCSRQLTCFCRNHLSCHWSIGWLWQKLVAETTPSQSSKMRIVAQMLWNRQMHAGTCLTQLLMKTKHRCGSVGLKSAQNSQWDIKVTMVWEVSKKATHLETQCGLRESCCKEGNSQLFWHGEIGLCSFTILTSNVLFHKWGKWINLLFFWCNNLMI